MKRRVQDPEGYNSWADDETTSRIRASSAFSGRLQGLLKPLEPLADLVQLMSEPGETLANLIGEPAVVAISRASR